MRVEHCALKASALTTLETSCLGRQMCLNFAAGRSLWPSITCGSTCATVEEHCTLIHAEGPKHVASTVLNKDLYYSDAMLCIAIVMLLIAHASRSLPESSVLFGQEIETSSVVFSGLHRPHSNQTIRRRLGDDDYKEQLHPFEFDPCGGRSRASDESATLVKLNCHTPGMIVAFVYFGVFRENDC